MKEEDKIKLIEDLEDIKNKNSIVIDDLEMSLSQLRKDHEKLIGLLMGLKSKVKNDEETKNERRRE